MMRLVADGDTVVIAEGDFAAGEILDYKISG
jgi:hypothetical protein